MIKVQPVHAAITHRILKISKIKQSGITAVALQELTSKAIYMCSQYNHRVDSPLGDMTVPRRGGRRRRHLILAVPPRGVSDEGPQTGVPVALSVLHEFRQLYFSPEVVAVDAAGLLVRRHSTCRLGRRQLDVLRAAGGRDGQVVDLVGEVELGLPSLQAVRGDVVGLSCHLGCRERAEPNARLLPGLSDLRNPLAPPPLPDTTVYGVAGAASGRADGFAGDTFGEWRLLH